jgi:16S rRNA (cytidine1402-2'-O)-methyltransferase
LTDIVEVLGEGRHVVIAREVTKLHEEFLRGRTGEVLEDLKSRAAVRGEITLLIAKAEEGNARVGTDAFVRPSVRQRVTQIMAEENVDEKAALKKVAKERGVSKSEAYRELQRSK